MWGDSPEAQLRELPLARAAAEQSAKL